MHSYKYGIIGGDERQYYIAQILKEQGHFVATYGSKKESSVSLQEAMDADVIISGIPFTRDEIAICALVNREDLTIEKLKQQLKKGQQFYAGGIPKRFFDYCEKVGVSTYDFLEDTNLTLYNTIATAEGAIAEALLHQPTNLHRSPCLVLGYGKCAKVLAKKIRGLEAKVTICARNEEDLSLADAFGYNTLAFLDWREKLGKFEYIFNTVPSVILDRDTLKRIRKDAVIIDIASPPGGVDYAAAEDMGIKACHALGLPGKYAPRSTAEALVRIIQNTQS